LSKQKYPQRHVYKISSARLQKAKWDLIIDFKQAKKREEIVDLADSTVLRFIRQIINEKSDDEFLSDLNKIKGRIKVLISQQRTKENTSEYQRLIKQYHEKLMVTDYVLVEMKKNSRKHKDFDRANNGFKINGKQYEYLLSTTGGVKNETVVYVSKEVHPELVRRIENGRNMEVKFVPAKLSAYRSLVCSASIPVPNPTGIMVIHDYERDIADDVIYIKDNPDKDNLEPVVTEDDNFQTKLNINDGYGFITYELAKDWASSLGLDYIPSSFIVRNAFCKGVLAVVDFHRFANEVAKTNIVIDAWNVPRDIHKEKIQIVLTTSMLKLWQSYDGIEQYIDNCMKNGYTFSVTKYSPKILESQRNLNYQFIQSLTLTNEDIEELIKPTIQMLNDSSCGDWAKTILYLKGDHLTEDTSTHYDFSTALTIDRRLMNDPHTKYRVKEMITKRMNDAKKGDLVVNGNFQMIVGDPYALLEHLFSYGKGFEYVPKGLLKENEFYSNYWNKKGVSEVVGFRAPMTVYNNIRKMNLVNSQEMERWYEHLNNVYIVNTFDLTLAAMNGADQDGDTLLTTDNPVIRKVFNNDKVIICDQKTADKEVTTRDSFIQADKNGFGNKIGSITNKGTSLYEILTQYKEGSREYSEILKRIRCIQKGQQDEIDKMKGIKARDLPKGWFDKKVWDIMEGDDELTIDYKTNQKKLVADKKPYFFIYNYEYLMNKFKDYRRKAESHCIFRFNKSLKEVLARKDGDDEEEQFIHNYYSNMPISMSNSTMNRICWRVEEQFSLPTKKDNKYDYNILKSNSNYDKNTYDKLLKLYEEHNVDMQMFKKISSTENLEKDEIQEARNAFVEKFKEEALSICNNLEELTNIAIDICYEKYKSRTKQFVWDIAGEQIIKNLLKKNDNLIHIPVQDESGAIEFRGERFTIITRKVEN
jgi:hypothetical protein